MRSDDIAAMLVAGMQPSGDLGFHQGVVLSWDEATGGNSVMVNGSTFTNLRVLSTGAITPFQVGDTVGLLRFQSTYFILGKIRAPGAGAAERIASQRVAAGYKLIPPGGSAADLAGSYGPEVQLYVGSARRVLVISSCEVFIGGSITADSAGLMKRGEAHQTTQVSGASTLGPSGAVTDAYFQSGYASQASATATVLVTAAQGLNSGLNTFTCKYRATADAGIDCYVNTRTLTVIPF